jgi:hypothetical protein
LLLNSSQTRKRFLVLLAKVTNGSNPGKNSDFVCAWNANVSFTLLFLLCRYIIRFKVINLYIFVGQSVSQVLLVTRNTSAKSHKTLADRDSKQLTERSRNLEIFTPQSVLAFC